METILSSFLLVAASEMGDKTQLLALVLALRFKKPWTIMFAILCATLLNHGIASLAGDWMSQLISPQNLKIILALTFIGFAAWILIPDKDQDGPKNSRHGAFLTTLVAFFLAEMGDKTQLATVALGAQYQAPIAVTIGTTLGMLFSDGLAVVFGERLTKKIPMKYVRIFAAATFFIFGAVILFRPL